MTTGVKEIGVKQAQAAISSVNKFLAGKTFGQRASIITIIGSDLRAAAEVSARSAHSGPGKSGALARSIEWGRAGALKIDLFTDLSIAPYGGMREHGGVITATMSAFKNRKTGQSLLFIPLRPDVFPRDWKTLTFGEDYVLVHSVRQKGSWFMRDAIKTRLRDGGRTPRLSQKLGFSITELFTRKSLRR